MKVALSTDRAAIFVGDSADLGQVLRENSVDAIVCDPPSGIAFMGRSWDEDKGGRDAWIAWLAKLLAPSFSALKPGGYGLFWALPRTSHWTAMALELAGFEIRDRVSHLFLSGFPKSMDVSKAIDASLGAKREVSGQDRSGKNALMQDLMLKPGVLTGVFDRFDEPATEQAAAWRGWGTALKPAVEDWWLVRKPMPGTVAANVLEYGVGGINIGGCRVGESGGTRGTNYAKTGLFGIGSKAQIDQIDAGRWPTHLVAGEGVQINDVEDPALYFYCPKPSRAETEAGLDHLPIRSGGDATGREDGSAGLSSPRAGAGRGGGRRNIHPTKKPIALMRYLCRLVTPPGGVVLDMFAGSGTTGVAALAEGFRFVGAEQGGDNEEYIPILLGRIRYALESS